MINSDNRNIIDFSKNLVVLAPLAGYTDLPFRSVVKKFGADFTVSEMISSNALAYNSAKTLKMLQKAPNETPYIVQLSANKEDMLIKAIEVLNDIDGIDGIDLNCGCPAPKVYNHGSGSALLHDLDKLTSFLKIIKKYSNKTYSSAKVRIGVDEKIPSDIAKAIEDGGVDFMSVHGRTKKGAYKAPVDYEAIATIKELVSIPVIANGDITDLEKSQKVLQITKADGVMIGRGAIGKPWIFYQIKNQTSDISDELKKEIILEHFDSMIEFYGEYGAVMFRKHLHTYSKGYGSSSSFRQEINQISDVIQARKVIDDFF
jgi:tRNA-dihydrouridine synthase B